MLATICLLFTAPIRAADASGLDPKIHEELRQALRTSDDSPARLRALWTLHTTGGLDARTVVENVKSPDEWVRAWTIQLVCESRDNIERLLREIESLGLKPDPDLYKMAETDPSPVVRLALVSAAQRLPDETRGRLVRRLLQRSEDADDHNIPLMLWYAMEPLVVDAPAEWLPRAVATKLPKLLQFTTRRIAALGTTEARELVVTTLGSLADVGQQREMLLGLSAALRGQRSVPMPKGWDVVESKFNSSADAGLRTLGQTLSLTFGSEDARLALWQTLSNPNGNGASRRAALEALVAIKDPETATFLRALLGEPDLCGAALRALAGYDDPQTPESILRVYDRLDDHQKRDALNTLASRAAYAKPLLTALAGKKVPSKDITADVFRQLRGLKDSEVQSQLTRIFGTMREVSADKKAEIEKYRRIYGAGGSQPGNASPGRVVFNKVCAQCHRLFDSGGTVGPDITGANRTDLNYLLESILDPNAVIPNEYRTTEIETKDGRNLVGIVKRRDDTRLVLQTANEEVTLATTDIASQRQAELSMMPEGLLAPLTDPEVRDLIYYLTRVGQVPLPTEAGAK